jgi:pimeloyl-ACP methyl ester carboxylesterase
MFHPYQKIVAVPSSAPWKMPYQQIVIPLASGHLKGWWIPADPRRVEGTKPPRVLLFLGGAGGNKSHYLDRVEGLRQLGFSLLLFDYRGYGESPGDFPSEKQFYTDSQAAWDYLIQQQKVPPQQIFLYGESLGGAIALDLAVKHPQAAGLIVQSSFTSMPEMARWRGFGWLFPVDLLLTQKFDSIGKVRSLRIPVLFIHGTADEVVPFKMGQRLFATALSPKYLHVVSGAGHDRLLRPGEQSYLKAIQRFIQQIN